MKDKKKEIDALIQKLDKMLKENEKEGTRELIQELEKLLKEYLEES